jgi:hypothetical protein
MPQAVSFIRKGDCDTAIVVGSSVRCWADYLVQMQVCHLVHVYGSLDTSIRGACGKSRCQH